MNDGSSPLIALAVAVVAMAIFLFLALAQPYAQWTIAATARKAPKPYVDVPGALWKAHWKEFFSVGYLVTCAICATAIGLCFVLPKNVAIILPVAGVAISVPVLLLQRRLGRIWREEITAGGLKSDLTSP